MADLLRQRRRDRQISVDALALKSGVSASTIRRWEKGITTPSAHELRLCLNALEADDRLWLGALALMSDRKRWDALVGQLPTALRAGLAPAVGNLWRLLRCRQRLTARELASLARVQPYQITRWEQGVSIPPGRERERLLAILSSGLLPLGEQERRMLEHGSLWLHEPFPHRLRTLEEYAEQLNACGATIHGFALPDIDVTLLLILEELLLLVPGEPRALHQIARLYGLLAARMGVWNQPPLRRQWARAGLTLIGLDISSPDVAQDTTWTNLIFECGYGMAPKLRLRLLSGAETSWRAQTQKVSGTTKRRYQAVHSQFLREMATVASVLGNPNTAWKYAQRAMDLADASEDAGYVTGSRRVWANMLLQNGNAEEALPFLARPLEPGEEAENVIEACSRHSNWAKAYLAVHQHDAAHRHLNEFFRLARTYGLEHLHTQGEVLARLLDEYISQT